MTVFSTCSLLFAYKSTSYHVYRRLCQKPFQSTTTVQGFITNGHSVNIFTP